MRSCTVFLPRARPRAFGLGAALLVGLAGCQEDAQSPTAPESTPALSTASASALSFSEVTTGAEHSCGVTTGDRAYCWGKNVQGQLGDGTSTSIRTTPVPVAGGHRFVQLSAGYQQTCGVTTDSRVYCWGFSDGGLGDGTNNLESSTPVAVAGGRRFRQVRAGTYHACALTLTDVAFCWGSNPFGQLGTGGGWSTVPVRVAGGLSFRRIIAGGQHTCAATLDDKAYCWGYNGTGELGDGTRTNRPKPVAVAGGLRFRQVLAGGGEFGDLQHQDPEGGHSCGVTTDDRAYCWGSNGDGKLGDGTRTSVLTPVAVAGMRRFRGVNPGYLSTCGVTITDVAFCWGSNGQGQLGDRTTTSRNTPVRVFGGLEFAGVSAGLGGMHSCGVTTNHRAYCWGYNSYGQLGDGRASGFHSTTPVGVAGPM